MITRRCNLGAAVEADAIMQGATAKADAKMEHHAAGKSKASEATINN